MAQKMTAKTKNPQPDTQKTANMDNAVSEIFDELFAEISSTKDFHPSETFNKQVCPKSYSNTKIYEFINPYHAFCKLCEQHFYRFSVADDINSFFQKHLNTSYHRQNRALWLPPNDVPIFTWEKKFYSGRCNVCDMSDLNSYVLKTEADIVKLMDLHVCIWSKEHRQTNENLLAKLTLIKKYCGLKIFQEKYLKSVPGKEVCLLCQLSFPATGKKAVMHLSSDIHYQNFCTLLRKVFSFEPRDVLNGFNLEMITRWVIMSQSPPYAQFPEYDERKVCVELSNNDENPYFEECENLSFSPRIAQRQLHNEETDFIHNQECMLCGKKFTTEHAKSQSHKQKTETVNKNSFDTPEKFLMYQKKREKRLYIKETIKKLNSGVLETPVLLTTPSNSDSVGKNFFKKLLQNELKLVREVYTRKKGELFCHVCNLGIPLADEAEHLNNLSHKNQAEEWAVLKENLENSKFFEPFVKIQKWFACLLCGIMFLHGGFCFHLKSKSHLLEMERYYSRHKGISISSTFDFGKDFSCCCNICKVKFNQKGNLASVKKTLQLIRNHWPCQSFNNVKNESKKVADKSAKVEQNGEKSERTFSIKETVAEKFEGEMVDFRKVQETVENIVGIFENKIINGVVDRSRCLVNNFGNCTNMGETSKTDEQTVAQQQLSCPDIPSDTCSPVVAEKKEQEKPNVVETQEQKTDSKAQERDESDEKDEIQNNPKKIHEVLVIQGIPNNIKREYLRAELSMTFKDYGNILYINFESTGKSSKERQVAVIAFEELGAAETIAKGPELYVNAEKLYLIATTKGPNAESSLSELSLNEDLVRLLKNPPALMDFVLDLVVQASRASESPVERKREEAVCSTIISAIFDAFPKGRCYTFGSRLSGLMFPSSDLDVFLDCGGMYEGFKNTSLTAQRKLINQVEKLLRKKRDITNFVAVKKARVPILSFLHIPTLMHCDVSFKNGLSVQKSLLIKFLMSLDWRVRPLILFLKHWVKLNRLHGPPFFSSYAVAILVIFYLQQLQVPVLPAIDSLQISYVGRRRTIAGWDCSINTSVTTKSENLDSLPQLFLGLFKFYRDFDYKNYMISPLTGKPLLREAYSEKGFTKLPFSYKRHILNLSLSEKESKTENPSIYIVDPFDLSHILIKSFTTEGLKAFVNFCGKSAEHLKKGLNTVQIIGSDKP